MAKESKRARESQKALKKGKKDRDDDTMVKSKFEHLPSETYEKDFTSRSKDR